MFVTSDVIASGDVVAGGDCGAREDVFEAGKAVFEASDVFEAVFKASDAAAGAAAGKGV